MKFTLKENPLTERDLKDFIKVYNSKNIQNRKETYSSKNPQGRWRCYTYKEILKRDKTSLDIFWIKDKSLDNLENIPKPKIILKDIVRNLETALKDLKSIN